MSSKPSRQARVARREAERDQKHWRAQRDKANNTRDRAFAQDGVNKAQKNIEKANNQIRKG